MMTRVRAHTRTRARARGLRVDVCTLRVWSHLDVSIPCMAGFSVHCVCWGNLTGEREQAAVARKH